MRALREQPRLVAAKLALVLAALVATALVAAAIVSDDSQSSPGLEAQLQRSEQLRRDQTGDLQRQAAEIARLRADLRTTAPSAQPRPHNRTTEPRTASRAAQPRPRTAAMSFRRPRAG